MDTRLVNKHSFEFPSQLIPDFRGVGKKNKIDKYVGISLINHTVDEEHATNDSSNSASIPSFHNEALLRESTGIPKWFLDIVSASVISHPNDSLEREKMVAELSEKYRILKSTAKKAIDQIWPLQSNSPDNDETFINLES